MCVAICLIAAILFEASYLLLFKIVDDDDEAMNETENGTEIVADEPRVCRIFAYYNESKIQMGEYCRNLKISQGFSSSSFVKFQAKEFVDY